MQPNVLRYSPGLGYVNRGLETFTGELYLTLIQENQLIKPSFRVEAS